MRIYLALAVLELLAVAGCQDDPSTPTRPSGSVSTTAIAPTTSTAGPASIAAPTDCHPFSDVTVPTSLGGGSISGDQAYAGMLHCSTGGAATGPARVDVWVFDGAHVPNAEEKALIEAYPGGGLGVMTANLDSYEKYARGLEQNPFNKGVSVQSAEVSADGWNFGIAWTSDRPSADTGLRYDGWLTFAKVAGDQALTCSYNAGLSGSPVSLTDLDVMSADVKSLCADVLASASR